MKDGMTVTIAIFVAVAVLAYICSVCFVSHRQAVSGDAVWR